MIIIIVCISWNNKKLLELQLSYNQAVNNDK